MKDGYRDTVGFTVTGSTTSGAAVPVTGTAVLRKNGTQITTWDLQSSTQRVEWSGKIGNKIRAGDYVLTAAVKDAAGNAAVASTTVQVSGRKLVAASATLRSSAVSGTHAMISTAKSGLGKAKVTLRITTTATGMKGTQKLVFSRGGKKIVVPVKNGTHTSRAIVIPRSFTKFELSHTWKTGKLVSAKYSYKYKKLK